MTYVFVDAIYCRLGGARDLLFMVGTAVANDKCTLASMPMVSGGFKSDIPVAVDILGDVGSDQAPVDAAKAWTDIAAWSFWKDCQYPLLPRIPCGAFFWGRLSASTECLARN